MLLLADLTRIHVRFQQSKTKTSTNEKLYQKRVFICQTPFLKNSHHPHNHVVEFFSLLNIYLNPESEFEHILFK